MKKIIVIFTLIASTILTLTAFKSGNGYKSATNATFFAYEGRHLVLDDQVELISAASSISFIAKGKEAVISMAVSDAPHAFVSIVVNGNYLKRYIVDNDKNSTLTIPLDKNTYNLVEIYKATEASTGSLFIKGVTAKELLPYTKAPKPYAIEFVGNSITSGFGADETDLKCGSGTWYDQHNAYFSYGSRLARKFNADFILNSVSGYGMYRNWNDENIEEPTLPQVYGNLHLKKEDTYKYDYSFSPDLVSICLGTNDLSDGDGVKPRLPFNKEKYVLNYIKFVTNIFTHHPNTKVALLNSPMVNGEKNELLISCLKEVEAHFTALNFPVKVVLQTPMNPTGCGAHPSIEEQRIMTEELYPQFKKILFN